MRTTDQAFLAAYERASQPTATAAPTVASVPPSVARPSQHSAVGAEGDTLRGPHFRAHATARPRVPLAQLIAEREGVAAQSIPAVPQLELVPAIEVERFSWPSEAEWLAKTCLLDIADLIDKVLEQPTPALAVASPRRGVGLTTSILAFAHVAKQAGMKTALIDLSTSGTSGLAQALGLSRVPDLSHTLSRGMSLADAMVSSHQDGVALLTVGQGLSNQHTDEAAAWLAAESELILIDAGVSGDTSLAQWAQPLQAASLLIDLQLSSTVQGETPHDAPRLAAADQLKQLGGTFLGVVENLA